MFSIFAAAALLLPVFTSALAIPHQQQQSIVHLVSCAEIDTYTTEWFLRNTLSQYRREIHSQALFYTRGTTKQARQLACNSPDEYVTIWDIWPKYLYNDTDVGTNKMRCIHNDEAVARTFYENMSRAYARMARKSATILHSFQDYAAPPMEGIWGRIELPEIGSATDIFEMSKINEDRSLSDVFVIPSKAAKSVYEAAIEEVRGLLRISKRWFGREEEEGGGSCALWSLKQERFLDGLF